MPRRYVVWLFLVLHVIHVPLVKSDHAGGSVQTSTCSAMISVKSKTCGIDLMNVTFRRVGSTAELPIIASVSGRYLVAVPCVRECLLNVSSPGYNTTRFIVRPLTLTNVELECASMTLCTPQQVNVTVTSQCGWNLDGLTVQSPTLIGPTPLPLPGNIFPLRVCGLPSTLHVMHPDHETSITELTSSTAAVELICKACGPLPIVPHSTVVIFNNHTLEYSCNAGYQIVGVAAVICIKGQGWSPAPTCQPMANCGTPQDIAFGHHSIPVDTVYGRTIIYECDPGYGSFTPTIAVCQLDGTWTPAPTCVPECGVTPVIPGAGIVRTSPNHRLLGGIVIYSCEPLYVMNGSPVIYCQANGDWSALPTCTQGCGPVPEVDGALYPASASTEVGSSVTYICGPDLHFPAGETITCQGDSQWSPQPLPPCVEWELLFRGISGVTDPVFPAWSTGAATTNANQLCMALENNACSQHYRSDKIDNWEALGVSQVRFSVYEGSTEVAYATFNAVGQNANEWFSRENLLDTTWSEMFAWQPADFQFFSLEGDRTRHFYATNIYSGCGNDKTFVVVIFGTEPGCAFDSPPYGRIIYATGPNAGVPLTMDGMAVADFIAISYKT